MLNNDIHSLIRQYKKYKKQKRFDSIGKIIAWILLPIVVVTTFLTFQNNADETETVKSIQPETQESIPLIEKKVEDIRKQIAIVEKPIEDRQKKDEPEEKKSVKDENLQRLLSYYTKRKSYSSTISIASYYYSYQEYENAVKWAIRASKINKNKDQPWIIYAKSKSALGNNVIAKKALETYLKFNESTEAEVLLKTLENNITK